jgi:hypothetical protein
MLISKHSLLSKLKCLRGATTLSIATLSIMGLVMTLNIDIQHNSIECQYAECRYAECHDYLNVMLNVIMLSVVRLNVVMLNVVRLNVAMLSVIAPLALIS